MRFGSSLRILGLAAMLLVAIAAYCRPSAAQDAAPQINASETERLLKTLENPEERQKFIEQLRALVNAQNAVEPPPAPVPDRVATRFLEMLSEHIAAVGDSLFRAAAFFAHAPQFYGWLVQELSDSANRARLLEIFAKVLAVLLAGWLAEYIVARILARLRRWIEARPVRDRWARVPWAAALALVMAVPIVVFAAVAFGTLVLVEPARVTRLVALALINANLLARVIVLLVSIVLVPQVSALRPVPLTDETAAYLYVWARRLTNIAVYGYFLAEVAYLLGLPMAGHDFLLKLLGLIVALLLIILVLQNRGAVALAIGEARAAAPEGAAAMRGTRRILAEYWHVAAILYIAVVFTVWLVRPQQGFLFVIRATVVTVIAFALARIVSRLAVRAMAAIFHITEDIRQRFPALESRANRYLQVFNIVAMTIIYGFAALVILQAWGIDSFLWITTPTGRRVGLSVVSLAITVLVALGLWEGINAALERYAKQTFGPSFSRRSARGRTLVTLAQRTVSIILVVLVGLVFLSEIGINIAPLIAGAGIVGLAVGLGAQTLVKNLIEGIANLLEDTFAVGDAVRIGDLSGVVEEISMRTVRLRDFAGHVHTVPFSEIKTVTNMTRDFAFAVFEIGVGYGSDIDRVCEVLRQEAAELRHDPVLGPAIVSDLDIVGLDKFGDSAVVIKSRLRVQPPNQQWAVMRAFNRRIKIAFDREGIEIPFPQRTVRVIGDAKLVGSAAGT